jgi:hypothetical protein
VDAGVGAHEGFRREVFEEAVLDEEARVFGIGQGEGEEARGVGEAGDQAEVEEGVCGGTAAGLAGAVDEQDIVVDGGGDVAFAEEGEGAGLEFGDRGWGRCGGRNRIKRSRRGAIAGMSGEGRCYMGGLIFLVKGKSTGGQGSHDLLTAAERDEDIVAEVGRDEEDGSGMTQVSEKMAQE